jgi:hypothetical protein
MAIFFLDPLVLAGVLGVVVYVRLVWRGTFRRWFGRDEWWTIAAWPLPLVLLAVPLLVGALSMLLSQVGIELGDGEQGVGDALLYTAMYVLPVLALSLLPTRWLLPPWARRRLTSPDSSTATAPPHAVAALRARAGHGSFACWVWRVDAVPGVAWVKGHELLWFPTRAPQGSSIGPAASTLEVDLREVSGWRVRGRRPWRRDGLVSFELAARPVHLWAADVAALLAQLPERGR